MGYNIIREYRRRKYKEWNHIVPFTVISSGRKYREKKTCRPSLLTRACRRRKNDRFPRNDKPENNGYSRCSIQSIIIIIAHLYSNNRSSVITSLLLVLFGMSLV